MPGGIFYALAATSLLPVHSRTASNGMVGHTASCDKARTARSGGSEADFEEAKELSPGGQNVAGISV
jgi:hypothetical protein